MQFNKSEIDKKTLTTLCKKYKLSSLEAAILIRRGQTSPSDILYYKESNTRFLHSPFLLPDIDLAIERIQEAIRRGDDILIYGDKDVDGIVATAILYKALKSEGALVSYRIPKGGDPYGITINAIAEFIQTVKEKDTGATITDKNSFFDIKEKTEETEEELEEEEESLASNISIPLIITVDNGITLTKELEYANACGIDVVVLDHHNAPEVLPPAYAIVDPKVSFSHYPFCSICAGAVVYKTVRALHFMHSAIYNQPITLLEVTRQVKNIDPNSYNIIYAINAIHTKNLCEDKRLSLTFSSTETNKNTLQNKVDKLALFCQGQRLYVWDKKKNTMLLNDLFGGVITFELLEIKDDCAKCFPSLTKCSLEELLLTSTMNKYQEKGGKIDCLFNIYVNIQTALFSRQYPNYQRQEEESLQLASLSTLADVMPMQDENKIFIKYLLEKVNKGEATGGLKEYIAVSGLTEPGKRISEKDLSWIVTPALNSTGRLGDASVSLRLLLEEDYNTREICALKIKEMNEKRKKLVEEGFLLIVPRVKSVLEEYKNKICIIFDKGLHKGVIGLIAVRILKEFNTPALILTLSEDGKTVIGSMRSVDSLPCTHFFSLFEKGFFLNSGGHNKAGGCSFLYSKMDIFFDTVSKVLDTLPTIDKKDTVTIDAELPVKYLTNKTIELVDKFSPFGEQNERLIFYTGNVKVKLVDVTGRDKNRHLKFLLDLGTSLMSAMLWKKGNLYKKYIGVKAINILYTVEHQYYNGAASSYLDLIDVEAVE